MKKTLKFVAILFVLGISMVFAGKASADIAMPSITTFYFQKDGKPYEKPLTFTIDVYGYQQAPPNFEEKQPGTYTPVKVRSFPSDSRENYSCPSYGCAIRDYNFPTVKYGHVDYYIFKIKSADGSFEVKDGSISYEKNCSTPAGGYEEYKCSVSVSIPSEKKTTTPTTVKKTDQTQTDDKATTPASNTSKKSLDYQVLFLIALAATIIIEVLVLIGLLKLLPKDKDEVKKIGNIIVVGALASLLTLPYLWFVMPRFAASYGWNVTISELLIAIIEAVIYSYLLRMKFGKALVISLVCNAASFLVGFWLLPLIF